MVVFPIGHQIVPRFKDLTKEAASGALRLTQNTGQSAFFGEKYKLEKVCHSHPHTKIFVYRCFCYKMFEDDGSVIEGATTVTYSPRRNLLILNGMYCLSTKYDASPNSPDLVGIAATRLALCKL